MVHQLLIAVHLLAVIFLVGYGLYGLILSLTRTEGQLIASAFRARWPPPSLPAPARVSVSAIGISALLLAVLTGFWLLFRGGVPASEYAPKLALVAVAFACEVALALRPVRVVLAVHFLVLLAAVIVAVMLAR